MHPFWVHRLEQGLGMKLNPDQTAGGVEVLLDAPCGRSALVQGTLDGLTWVVLCTPQGDVYAGNFEESHVLAFLNRATLR